MSRHHFQSGFKVAEGVATFPPAGDLSEYTCQHAWCSLLIKCLYVPLILPVLGLVPAACSNCRLVAKFVWVGFRYVSLHSLGPHYLPGYLWHLCCLLSWTITQSFRCPWQLWIRVWTLPCRPRWPGVMLLTPGGRLSRKFHISGHDGCHDYFYWQQEQWGSSYRGKPQVCANCQRTECPWLHLDPSLQEQPLSWRSFGLRSSHFGWADMEMAPNLGMVFLSQRD